ncbi:alpha/beta fold hydrolase [Oscillatoria sp. CS-180]|uniref:alpha/beta fold hydrolase n=1 Tax=Oscillatoria sp. CS-180 TaxID=3021720 RepID=UPI00232AF2FE|nr:alpha/beta fold hydrolase [Oscillatoria sp. CS-180]MDB9529852.1 alpha/beta fold hydrolase [Oscillatoria sp. CS-180]
MTTAIASSIHSVASLPGEFWDWQGNPIYYVKAGAAKSGRPPLLLIHGFGASTDHWRKNIHGLKDDFEVWAIDLLGFGRSAKPDRIYSPNLWRDQLHDFIQTVIGQPAVLAGNSLGGYASLCVAADYPDSVAGVILLNSAGSFEETPASTPQTSPFQKAIRQTIQNLLLQPLPSWLLFQYVRQPSNIRRTLKQVYVDQTVITDQLIEDIRRPSNDPGAAKVFASVFSSPKGDTVDLLLGRMQAPLLLIWGEGDPWMGARQRNEKFRQYYPNLTEHFLNAGHCPHDEVPQQVNLLMREWVLNLSKLT